MTVSARDIALVAALGSLSMLLAAWGFQYIGGFVPCPLCLSQRWPHAAAAAIGAAVAMPGALRPWAWLGAATMGVSTGLAVYHSGVERSWWAGPSSCAGGSGDIGALSPEALLEQIMTAPIVRCDEIAWSLFGLSMPNYNVAVSLALGGLWVAAALRR